MSIKQCLRHAGFSLVVVSALLTGCDDSSDSTSDEEAQTEDDDESNGSSGTSPRAGRNGSNTSTAGRAAGGSGGRGGAGATTGSGNQGGRGSSRGGRGGDGDEGGSGGRTGAGGRVSTPGDSGGAGGSGGAEDSDDAGVAIIELNDGQIAEITSVVNTGEISLGMLAANRALVPAAQDYAQTMIAMHTAAQERQAALVASLGITPSSSALSARLTEDAARIRTTLESAEALDFDLLYIRTQVDMHARVLLTIDEQLLPNVTEEPLRADLLVTRAEVATHLEQAQAILATLEVGDTDAGVP